MLTLPHNNIKRSPNMNNTTVVVDMAKEVIQN